MPPQQDLNHLAGAGGLQDMLANIVRRIDNLALQNNGHRPPVQVPTYTDLSGYPDPGVNGWPYELPKQKTFIPYFGEESVGGIKLKPIELRNSCKSYIAEAIRKGQQFNISHERCISELFIENARGNARFLLQAVVKDPNHTLETVVRALEVRYLNLVEPEEARAQLFRVERETPDEEIHTLRNRIQDRAQMAVRGIDPERRVRAENEMTKSHLMACLSFEVRSLLRERERTRMELGRGPFTLDELTEAAVQEETARNAEHRRAAQAQSAQAQTGEKDDKSLSFSFHTPSGRSPPPKSQPDRTSADGPPSKSEPQATAAGTSVDQVKIYNTDGKEIPLPPGGNVLFLGDSSSIRSASTRDRSHSRGYGRDRDRNDNRRDPRERSNDRNGDRGRQRDRGYSNDRRDRTPGRSADRRSSDRNNYAKRSYTVDPEKVGVKPNSCLRCGDESHTLWTCPTYSGPLPNGSCFRCHRGMHFMSDCVGEKADPVKPDGSAPGKT